MENNALEELIVDMVMVYHVSLVVNALDQDVLLYIH